MRRSHTIEFDVDGATLGNFQVALVLISEALEADQEAIISVRQSASVDSVMAAFAGRPPVIVAVTGTSGAVRGTSG